ncbi:hypothetical protein LPN01_05715 [Sphingomonas sp. A2-49]|uniref:hypothetical protein n=1 Tax=Sphingomonas sp. A2-49 TaxID=1391375 RepID=UPI0021CFED2F|nr:hypothetical protein [Sphingomonas sp. A2-49]MCU6453566.1 hypothetical protein [Sphingomonas sp. A2-49]
MNAVRPLLLIACIAGLAAPAAAVDRATVPGGDRQRAYFLERLTRMADQIERQAGAGALGRGQAAFLRQDLDRVWLGVTDDIRRAGRLTEGQRGSYAAMLRRVDLRLIRAEARRDVHRSVREQ